MKLRTKILSYTLPLILIPFLLTALAVYYFVIRANHIQHQEEKKQSLNEVVVRIGQQVDSARRDIELLSNVPAIAEFLENESANDEQIKTVLELFFRQNPYYLQLSLVDENGHERIKFSKLPNEKKLKSIKNKDYFRRVLITGSVQTPVLEIQPEKFATIFTQRIAGAKFTGMVVLILNTDVFEREMRPLLKRELATFLFDDRGVVLAKSFDTKQDEEILAAINLAEEANKLLNNSDLENFTKDFENEGERVHIYFLPSESFLQVGNFQKQAGEHWFLGTVETRSENYIPTAFQIFFFSILFFAVAAVLFLAAKASRNITVPLEKVSAATNKIARGETDLDLDIKTGDEVEDLATAVNRMNRELQDFQKRLVQAAKLASMGEMTSEISHEIQNRISGISLWLQHLDSEIETDDPKQEYLDEMKQGLQGFMEMLASLKQYYKTPVLELSDIDVNLLVQETIPFVQEIIDKKNVEMALNLFDSLPIIKGDEEKLKSVILNLLLNAVDSLEKDGKIEVQTDFNDAKEKLIFSISDNGSGIEEEDLSRIFYPFYSTKSGGSGLGLAVSANIISAHKGRIEVESQIGKGTTFTVFLNQTNHQDTKINTNENFVNMPHLEK